MDTYTGSNRRWIIAGKILKAILLVALCVVVFPLLVIKELLKLNKS